MCDAAIEVGEIFNMTTWASLISLFDVAHSVGKSAVDRLKAELALAAPSNVRFLSLFPVFVGTDSLLEEVEERTPASSSSAEPLPSPRRRRWILHAHHRLAARL